MEEPDEDLSPCSAIGEERAGGTEQDSTGFGGKFSSGECVCAYAYTVP